MLEIDYNLLPLSEEESGQIARRARVLARRGKAPAVPSSSFGRVVVVNPYEGFTLHHVPDDLRRPLRRAMFSAYAQGKPIAGRDLVEQILEGSDETIYQIVIELHSEFPGIISFLEHLPKIQRRYPECRVLLHANIVRVNDLLTAVMKREGARCDLMFEHLEEPVRLESQADVESLMIELPRYPAFPSPFFSTLRIRHQGGVGEFDINSLRRLYSQFGVGHIDELDLSGKLREKLVVLDIPLSAIEFIRFSSDRGEAFRGVSLRGEIVRSEQFREHELEARDLPFSMVEAFYRQLPGRGQDEIRLERVRALRINCFDGHVSFLWKPRPGYIPLYEVKGIRLHLNAGNGDAESLGDLENLAGETDGAVTIDSAVVTERGQPRFGDVRANIRAKFLEHIFVDNLARQIKLQRYAAKLKIGCLGAMAAQAIKLMRPYGLGQVVPENSLYYLCDSYRQLPEYYKAQERVERLYDSAMKTVKSLFGDEGGAINHELITHRLPLLNEWVNGEMPIVKEVTAEQLDTIYKELKIFLGFAENEYQRVERNQASSDAFFERLEQCRKVSLEIQHLANLLGGRYGRLPDRDSFPDFVFFGTDTDILQNRQEFFLPGLALVTLFKAQENQALFHTEDFEFAVFLEEQLSILRHVQSREKGEETEAEFQTQYFAQRIAEMEQQIERFEQTIQAAETAPAEQVLSFMEEMHRDETKSFRMDRDGQAEMLQKQEDEYFQALKAVNAFLDDQDSEADLLLSGDDYVRALDRQLMKKSQGLLANLRELVRRSLGGANALIKQKREELKTFLLAFTKMQKAMFAHLQAEYAWQLVSGHRNSLPDLLEKLNAIGRASARDYIGLEETIRKRQELATEDLKKLEGQLTRGVEKNQGIMVTIRETHRGLGATLSQPLRETPGEGAPSEMLAVIEERLSAAHEELEKIAAATESSRQTVESLRGFYREKSAATLAVYGGKNELAMLEQVQGRSRLQRMMGTRVSAPLIPAAGLADKEEPVALAEQQQTTTETWKRAAETLLDFELRDKELGSIRSTLDEYSNFQQVYSSFHRAVRRKLLGQRSVGSITDRISQLEKEAGNLDEFIRENMLPAQAEFARRVNLPAARKRLDAFRRTQAFVEEVREIQFEALQREFLDRGIFRRFHITQFRRGAYFGLNPELPIFSQLTNLMQGLSLFHRGLVTSIGREAMRNGKFELTKLPSERPPGIIRFIEEQRQLKPDHRYNYLVLPGTLSLSQALEIIQHKDAVFAGLPQLVLVYISKYDAAAMREDEELRERYFNAVKHNVIINIDESQVVDSPKAIGDRILQDTLGCAFDFKPEFPGPPPASSVLTGSA